MLYHFEEYFKGPGTTWCTRRHPSSCGVSIGRNQIEEVHSSQALLEAVHFNARWTEWQSFDV